MKSSYKLSFASLAVLGLPLAGVSVAAAQDAAPEVTRISALGAKSQAAAGELRSGNAPFLIVTQENGDGFDGSEALGVDIDPMRGWSEDNLDAYAAYWEAGYNYRQLLTLTEEWNLSEFEAKAQAGRAILAGDTSSFDALVEGVEAGPEETGEVVSSPADAFWDAGFTYDDALVLAEEWNVDTYEAKVEAATLITAGDQAEVEALLAES